MSDITRAEKISLAQFQDLGRYIEGARSAKTWRGYASDWARFTEFCEGAGLSPLPASPETVAFFLGAEVDQGRKAATLGRRLAAISVRHKGQGYESPCSSEIVRSVLAGIKREIGSRPNKKAPLRITDIRKIAATLGDSPQDVRNRAILLLGYAGAFRRSELAGLVVADIRFAAEGMVCLLRFSKTDQEGKGLTKAIPYGSAQATCPVRAVEAWIKLGGITEGSVFRQIDKYGRISIDGLSPKGVSRVVKSLASSVGMDAEDFGGHSLRSGLITDGYAVGVAEADIMAMSGHKSREVLNSYRQEANQFAGTNVAGRVGL